MKVADKIRFSLFIVALIVATIISLATYTIAKVNLEKAIFDHLETAAQSRAEHVKALLGEYESRVKIMAKFGSIRASIKASSSNTPDSQEFIEKALSQLGEFIGVGEKSYEIFVIDLKGRIIVSTDKSNVGLDRSTDIYFLEGAKEVYIKDAYYSEITKKNSIVVSAPVSDKETGELLGVVVSRIKLDDLNKIVADRTGLGETGEIYLINKYGYMITPSRFMEDVFLKQKVDTVNSRNAFSHIAGGYHAEHKKRETALSFSDYRNVKVIGTYAHILQMQWVLLAEINEAEALEPLSQIRRVSLWVLFFTLILAVLIGNFISGTITRPIVKLQEGTEIIGQGNLNYSVGTDLNDEIGALSRAFDKMTHVLKATMTSRDTLEKEVAERKKAEKSLRQTQAHLLQSEKLAAVGQLSAGVAHEIKNPLAVILLSMESMEDILPDLSNKNQERMAMIKGAAERADTIITELLNFSRKADMKMQPVDLLKAIKGAIILVKNMDKDGNVDIREEFGGRDEFFIMGDHTLLEHAFLNLFANAIDAMKSSGTLSVKLSAGESDAGEEVIIEVADTGEGMPAGMISKIFEPFFTTKEQGKGTGLGLSTVYMIIERHDGSIKVESKEGEGTKFTITLPFSREERGGH